LADIPEGFRPARFSTPFLDVAGPYYTSPNDNGLIVGIRIEERHINGINIAHGGVLSTLADVALSLQLHMSEKPRLDIATVTLNTNFLAGAQLGQWVEAHARIDRKGKRTGYCSGHIIAGDTKLMTMSAVFAIIRK